jgi:hypothetical protein
MSISSVLKDRVWDRYIGRRIGYTDCYLKCGTKIRQSHFECGHIVSRKDGGVTSVDNLRPICSKCNKSMGCNNMIKFVNLNHFDKCGLYDPNFDELCLKECVDKIKPAISEYDKLKAENEELKKINKEYFDTIKETECVLANISVFFNNYS